MIVGGSSTPFFFNSLSSQLADTGDRVVQGGAVTSRQKGQEADLDFSKQTGANTSDIKAVKDSDDTRGFRLRAWRVVR